MQRRKISTTSNPSENNRPVIPFLLEEAYNNDNDSNSNSNNNHNDLERESERKFHHRSRRRNIYKWIWAPIPALAVIVVVCSITLLVVVCTLPALVAARDGSYEESAVSSESSGQQRILSQKLPDMNSVPYADDADDNKNKYHHHHHHPRVIGYYFGSSSSESFLGVETIDPNVVRLYRYGSQLSQGASSSSSTIMTTTDVTPDDAKRQFHVLEDSQEYGRGRADVFEKRGDDCVAQYEWQTSSRPSCNLLLEQDMTSSSSSSSSSSSFRPPPPPVMGDPSTQQQQTQQKEEEEEEPIRWIANGYWRDVWEVSTPPLLEKGGGDGNGDKVVLKTMRYEHEFEERNYDRHRRDAVATERLTSSKNVLGIWGYCGNSGLFEYADGGSVLDFLWHNNNNNNNNNNRGSLSSSLSSLSPQSRLVVAHQLASGLAAVHNIDKEGVPSIAHTDISPGQFVYVNKDRLFKLNDFNRCRFIRRNEKTGQLCPYHVGNNPGTVSESESVFVSFLPSSSSRCDGTAVSERVPCSNILYILYLHDDVSNHFLLLPVYFLLLLYIYYIVLYNHPVPLARRIRV
jgi:hypothetical protein